MNEKYLYKFDAFLDLLSHKNSGISEKDFETIHKIYRKYCAIDSVQTEDLDNQAYSEGEAHG